jgi:2'-hydroxyisoflavone reductase
MNDRREFLIGAAGALAMGNLPPGVTRLAVAAEEHTTAAAKSLRILMIGGTGFLGSHHAHAAVARSHRVTTFSRGEKKLDLPPGIEILRGDRYKDLDLIAHQDWDAVIDFAAFSPLGVRTFGEALKGRVGHYTLISTVAVYERPKIAGKLMETSPLLAFEGTVDPYSLTDPRTAHEYGSLKVLCETEAEKQFPGRTLILRPGYIAGPGESQGQFAYWTLRMEKGGEVLVAGVPTTPVQFIDARDMADWCIRTIERRAAAIYNITGPAKGTDLSHFIEAARSSAPTASRLTWVPASWLAAQNDKGIWENLLYWSLEADSWGWVMQMNIDKALATGLTFRPIGITRADTVAWYRTLLAERQAELLSVQKKQEKGAGFETEPISWQTYLEREKEALAAWHDQQPKRK